MKGKDEKKEKRSDSPKVLVGASSPILATPRKEKLKVESVARLHSYFLRRWLQISLFKIEKSFFELLSKEGKLSRATALALSVSQKLDKVPAKVYVLTVNLKQALSLPLYQFEMVFKTPIYPDRYERARKELEDSFEKNWFLLYLVHLFKGVKTENFLNRYQPQLRSLGIFNEIDFKTALYKKVEEFKKEVFGGFGIEPDTEEELLDERDFLRFVNRFLEQYGFGLVPLPKEVLIKEVTVSANYLSALKSVTDYTPSKNAYLSFVKEVAKRSDIEEFVEVVRPYLLPQRLYLFQIL